MVTTMSASEPDVSRVGRGLRNVGVVVIAGGVILGVLRAIYIASGPSDAPMRAALIESIRQVGGGMLCVLAGAGLTSRTEYGRLVARNASLVSALFGLSGVVLFFDPTTNPWVWITTIAWFASVAFECAWLARPGIRSQFSDTGHDAERVPSQATATAVLVFAGALAVGTSVFEATSSILHP